MSLHLTLPPAREKESERPEPDPLQVAAWLTHITKLDAPAAAQALIDFLTPMNRRRMRVALRQEISESLIVQAEHVLAQLTEELADVSIPLPDATRFTAQTIDTLLTELAYSYKLLLMEQSRRLFGLASSGRAQLPVVRTMQLLSQRLLLSYRIYASPPRSVWLELHALYQFALRRGFAQRGATEQDPAPIELYREALLIAFAEPRKFMAGDLQQALAWVRQFGARAMLAAAPSQPGGRYTFLVRTQRDMPGGVLSKRAQSAAQQHDFVLNAQPLQDVLNEQLAHLDTGESSEGFGLAAPPCSSIDLHDLLSRLAKHWGGATNRRHERSHAQGRVALHIGIGGIWRFLNNASGSKIEPSEWLITNESAGGFAVTLQTGQFEPIRVGDVVGMRARLSDDCHVCVVRWIRSDNARHVELGLEEIAPAAQAVSIRKLRDNGNRNPEPALLLPEVPHAGAEPAILAARVPLNTTCELNLGELHSLMRVKATRLLERTVCIQLLQFNAVS